MVCQLGALDFAGGTFVHISSGFAVLALALALVIGKRIGYDHDEFAQHPPDSARRSVSDCLLVRV